MAAKNENSLWMQAKKAQEERLAALSEIEVELQVVDNDHARSAEVVSYCVSELSHGVKWEELRRKLGLGDAGRDRRWRTVRAAVGEHLIPKTEEEALKAQADQRGYLLGKVEEFVGDVESILCHIPNTEEDRKVLPTLLKLKLDSIRTLLDENQKSFHAYVDLKKAKQADSRNQGTSIIINNAFHINRPGSAPKDVIETQRVVSNLIESAEAMGVKSGTDDGRQ